MSAADSDPIALMRKRVVLHEDRVSNVSSIDFPGNFIGEHGNFSWNLEQFKEQFRIVIGYLSKDDMEFDIIGIDASIANALRRILISEVPTMAIETVYMMNNTGVMHDEVLAQRLGLIPIHADPRKFEYRTGPDDPATDMNTLVFQLNVKCTKNPNASPSEVNPAIKYINSEVLARHLEWQPEGDQETMFENNRPCAGYGDILITKLRPGQEIVAELHCHKGIGKEHAKWSPVATASYRLLPDIQILSPITGPDAHKFQKCFPPGTVSIVKNKKGEDEARVVNPRKDTASREALRHEEFKDKVRLTRVRDHFIFSIESTGALPPQILLLEAVGVMLKKCQDLKQVLLGMGLRPSNHMDTA